jgi:threonine aldolase
MRFQSAQLIAYLTDDLWLRMAANSNARLAELASGLRELDVEFLNRPDVNMVFARIDDDVATALEEAGLLFYRIRPGVIRLVTSWQTTPAEIDEALAWFAKALA